MMRMMQRRIMLPCCRDAPVPAQSRPDGQSRAGRVRRAVCAGRPTAAYQTRAAHMKAVAAETSDLVRVSFRAPETRATAIADVRVMTGSARGLRVAPGTAAGGSSQVARP